MGDSIVQMSKGQGILKQLLLLVLLLDQAATSRDLPSQAPLLFTKSGRIKTSEEASSMATGWPA